ncbi:tripartite tricarboxylate transporter permease [Rhodoplanes serenus]|jgi:putative tricarboxylic transport membrane protein|uniref:Tripartite tricarboxylate transporter permease n=1 Tax=Rhodoplanes serenus TaxID=200615 RepID=A0A327KEB3_9BRAD|nr:tripartite tricarboxylate transporter permease [Rhodoplanes serenus]MTW19167.1 tripartite tricarboxylate transporter permease [Rhodoplanes serenus]RAI35702.1 tripartite tricarboxylate transporter TctA [Rhodoplanes serenus]
MLEQLLGGFAIALQPTNILIALSGCLIGTLIGVLPGLGPAATLAMLIPLIFSMSPATALILLTSVYYGAMYGGSTTSILVNIPGESASVITTIDGHKMAMQGRAGPALAIAAIGSFIAGTFSVVMLSLVGKPIATYSLLFGPAEFFALMVFGLCTVASLTGTNVLKSIITTCFGLMIATVGIDLVSGAARFTFGNPFLSDGIDFVVIAIGMFALTEVVVTAREVRSGVRAEIIEPKGIWVKWSEFVYSLPSIGRGTVFGFLVGMLPGAGATLSTFIAYNIEKRLCRNPERLGTGDIRGVACPEAANNAASGASLVPLLTLGLPGGGATAVMLGALMMLDIAPGPLMFEKHGAMLWTLIASMYVGNVLLLVLNWPLVNVFARVMRVPAKYLMPIVLVVSTIGVWGLNYSDVDLVITGAAGVLGYYMRQHKYPIEPLVLGLILGGKMEQAYRQALIISDGSNWIFFEKPIALVLLICAVAFLFLPVILKKSKQFAAARATAEAS